MTTATERVRVLNHMVGVIQTVPLYTDPMHYIELPRFFPHDIYDRMLAELPPLSDYKILSEDSRKGAGTRAILTFEGDAPGVWGEVVSALTETTFKEALLTKFNKTLTRRFNVKFDDVRVMPFAPLVRLLRDTEGFKIAPHCDKPSKAITLQIYLPPDSSQSHLGTSIYKQGHLGFQEVRRVPFIPNYGYAFPMTHHDKPSWHGVETVGKLAYPRDSIIFGLHI